MGDTVMQQPALWMDGFTSGYWCFQRFKDCSNCYAGSTTVVSHLSGVFRPFSIFIFEILAAGIIDYWLNQTPGMSLIK